MISAIHPKCATTTNIDRMITRLGIDAGFAVVPRFGLTFSCALRTCRACTAGEACTEWLAKGPDALFGPPKFCPNVNLLWELLCDPAIGCRRHCVN
jgi:Family of unknown function (DUF6455)